MSDFVIMAKPVGSLCSMRCSYCYYLHADTAQLNRRMSDEMLETFIRNYMQAIEGDVISFTWHGGEPMLAGLDFYRRAVQLQKKYLPEGKSVWNNLQTNGLHLDEDWCRFLRENHFDIGVSVDGTKVIHDLYRTDSEGNGTWQRVHDNILLLKKYGISPDLLCTVTSDTANSAISVYRALKALDTGWIQFIPIVRRENGAVSEDSVKPNGYGRFLKQVFREWASHDMGKVNVQLFAETALMLAGRKSNVCWLSETCGNVLIAEADGSVYSCDHFADRNHRLGSFMESGLRELYESAEQTSFAMRKKESLSRECRDCSFLSLCNGCCPKDRFLKNRDGEEQYYLCEGMKQYYEYAVPVLQKAMRLSQQGYTPKEVMKRLF